MLNGREVYLLFKEGFKAGDEVVFTRQHDMLWCGDAGWATTTLHLYKPYKVDSVYGRDGKKIKIQGALYNPDGMKLYKKGNYSALFEIGDKVRCILKDKNGCIAKRKGGGWVHDAIRTIKSLERSRDYKGTFLYFVEESTCGVYEECLTLIPLEYEVGDKVIMSDRGVLDARQRQLVEDGEAGVVHEDTIITSESVYVKFGNRTFWVKANELDLAERDGVVYIETNTNKTITDDVIKKEEEKEMKVIISKVFKDVSLETAEMVDTYMQEEDLGKGFMAERLLSKKENKDAVISEARKRKDLEESKQYNTK